MSDAPFLLIDAGNSRVKWAMAQPDGTRLASGVFAHRDASPAQDAAFAMPSEWPELPTPRGVWISNVAGQAVAARIDVLLDARFRDVPRTTIRASAKQGGVTNRYTTPSALGSDRWAGMIGAHAAFPDEPLLIATFGTATTLEALRADGTFVGGLIAPGWTLMMRSLGEHTAQLPTLDASSARGLLATGASIGKGDEAGEANAVTRRGPFFATDTPRSLSAGCALAQAGLIERMWHDLQDEWRMPVRLIVSGGAADEVTAALNVPHTRHDSLVLSGLALIAAESFAVRHA
ncbi:type III pantothenate kinase [Paraburkholderia sp.]|uniref:type III pantothenate kinase n=1 Tax=Paraburkholderia sp. TaxID=1926495 RepID=UPI00238AEC76|nr:type III pantothenate kinase [Paraburkholderia sp.]MDE1178888.1 type III pantothenate kinase [Paraburkholderia sp.]